MSTAARSILLAAMASAFLVAIGGCSHPSVDGTPVPVDHTNSVPDNEIRVFDAAKLAEGVKTVVQNSYGVTGIDEVRCPEGEEVRKGNRFDCTVVIKGRTLSVPVTVRDETGEYEVGTPK